MLAELIPNGDVTKLSGKICMEFRGDACLINVGFSAKIRDPSQRSGTMSLL